MLTSYFKASGKLLLFGEYLVLRNSKSLAVPLNVGQQLEVAPQTEEGVVWKSFEGDSCWLEINLSENFVIVSSTDNEKAQIVQQLLKFIQKKKPNLKLNRLKFKVNLDFDREFGFGTSSTFISLLSQWSGVDPYLLLENSFGGSGYDIAAATAEAPIVYTIKNKVLEEVELSNEITDNLLFVYLGKKQISSKEIAKFKAKEVSDVQIKNMNTIVDKASHCVEITEWENLMKESENMLSSILNLPTVKERFFSDYPFEIKSLGAWGGDFVMATCRDLDEAKSYFLRKEMYVCYTYREIVKNHPQ